MSTAPARSLLYYLQQVPDSRGRKGRRHDFVAMLATVICAVLSNHGNYESMVQWIHLQEVEFWHCLGYLRTPPKATTFRRLLSAVSADALQTALWQWITEGLGRSLSAEELQPISIDGKTLRGTKSRHTRAWQVLTLLDQKTGCVLSQAPVGENTNEARAAQEFLQELVLEGKLVVGDAAYCQKDFCQTVLDGGGDYLVLVKDNQPQLHRAVQQAFVIPTDFSPYQQRLAREAQEVAQTVEKNRGRYERHTLTSTTVGVDQFGWPGAAQALRLERHTVVHGTATTTVQYAVTSISRRRASTPTLLKSWRGRWDIENRVFWVRDMVFQEDSSRIRTGQAPLALSVIRNVAINLLRHSGVQNLTAALREHAVKLDRLLARLQI